MPELSPSEKGYRQDWINQCFICLQISGAASLAMLMSIPLDRTSKYQWLLLIFSVIVHGMMVTNLEGRALTILPYTQFFYYLYDELIILTYLAMIGVSYNGLNTAYTNSLGTIQRFIYGTDVYYNRYSEALLKREKDKERL